MRALLGSDELIVTSWVPVGAIYINLISASGVSPGLDEVDLNADLLLHHVEGGDVHNVHVKLHLHLVIQFSSIHVWLRLVQTWNSNYQTIFRKCSEQILEIYMTTLPVFEGLKIQEGEIWHAALCVLNVMIGVLLEISSEYYDYLTSKIKVANFNIFDSYFLWTLYTKCSVSIGSTKDRLIHLCKM